MLDTLVVLATHRSPERVDMFLDKVRDHTVAVVETSCDFIERDLPPNAFQLHTPYRGYDTGAYLWAYFTLHAKNYLFLQDSCLPTTPKFVEPFARLMPADNIGVVSWVGFAGRIWDGHEQRTSMQYTFDSPESQWGIFGPIFYTSRASLDILRTKSLLPPYPIHKQMAQAMERGWGMAFEKAKIPTARIYPFLAATYQEYADGMMPPLTKVFMGRQG